MKWRLLDYDPETRTSQHFAYEEAGDKWHIRTTQDVEPYLDLNKALQNEDDRGYTDKAREWRHAARIPNLVIEKWLKEENIDVFNPDHWPAVQRKLNSNEYRYLRTALFNV